MNEGARNVLIMTKARQIIGGLWEGNDGRCALGVLTEYSLAMQFDDMRGGTLCDGMDDDQLERDWGLSHARATCPECSWQGTQRGLVIHFNDDHGFDFLTIARKMP